MRRVRQDVELLAGSELAATAADLDVQGAGKDLEVLGLHGMEVRRRRGSSGRVRCLEHEHVLRGLAHVEDLAWADLDRFAHEFMYFDRVKGSGRAPGGPVEILSSA